MVIDLFFLGVFSICLLALAILLKLGLDYTDKRIRQCRFMPECMKDYKEQCDMAKLSTTKVYLNALLCSTFVIFFGVILSMIILQLT